MTFVQTRTMRDTAAMLDCLAIPQPGDPFVIERPAEPFSAYVEAAATATADRVLGRPPHGRPGRPGDQRPQWKQPRAVWKAWATR